MKWRRKFFDLTILFLLFPTLLFADPSDKVIIFHTGSLSVPFARIEKTFVEEMS